MATNTSTRRPSKAQLTKEAKAAAFELATDKLVDNVATKLPQLARMAGLSEDKAALVEAFLSDGTGKSVLVSAMATVASYAPVPEKYESVAAKAAESLRVKAMKTGGNAIIDMITPFFDGIFAEFKQAEKAHAALDNLAKSMDLSDLLGEETETVSAKGKASKKASLTR